MHTQAVLALGRTGLGIVDVTGDAQGFTVLAQLALTVILFNQAASSTKTRGYRSVSAMRRDCPAPYGSADP